ncbi:MerR family transcriptional regulator [soil metagenome]
MDRRLTVGEFSRVSHLTVRMLRRYHDGGLLQPDQVDPVSGYRYYSLEQVPIAQTIRRFRDLGLPVTELRELLATADDTRRDEIVSAHLERLEEQLGRTQDAIGSLRALLGPRRTAAVTVVDLPARQALGVRDVVAAEAVLDWYGAARADLDAAVAQVPVTGSIGGRYAHELFTEGRGEVLAYTPCDGAEPGGRVERLLLPRRTMAVLTHHGPHHDVDLSYAVLGSWVVREGIGADGPVEEVYDVGPADDPDPDAWRTRLAWPVTRGLSGR